MGSGVSIKNVVDPMDRNRIGKKKAARSGGGSASRPAG
jgi:pantothenate kinase